MNRYDSYKDSGVEWIGEIPSHWSFGEMKYQLSNNDVGVWGKDVKNENEGTVVIRSTEITIDGNWDLSNPMKRLLSNSEIEKTLLFEGDIVLTKSSGSPDHIGKSVVVDSKVENLRCCYSNFVRRLRLNNYDSKLYHYILNNYVVREQYRFLTQSSTGLGNLNGTTLNEVKLPFIPLSEQQQIVSFLDTKTALIDALMEKTQRKIELLKEKRTALINEVVTKGLNSNAAMKDSGVEWIGEIPSHWDRVPFKYEIEILTDFTSNGSFKSLKENVEYLEEGYSRLVRLTDLRVNLENDGIYISEESHKFLSKSELFGGEILISCVGHYTGFVTKMLFDKGECSLGPNMLLIRNKKVSSNVDYLIYLLNSDLIQSGLKNGINKTAQEKINKDNVKDLQIIRPSLIEQQQIVAYLDKQTQLIDKTVSIEEKRISLLKEYRQVLISEVVTGKRKVVE